MELTQPPEIVVKRGRGRPRKVCTEVKIKNPLGRPLGSISEKVHSRTDEENFKIRQDRTKKYFTNNPKKLLTTKASYQKYYESHKDEINERRRKKKEDKKTDKITLIIK